MTLSPTNVCGAVAAAAQGIHEAIPAEYVVTRIVCHCIAAAAVSLGLYFAADRGPGGGSPKPAVPEPSPVAQTLPPAPADPTPPAGG